jgi:arginine repressor
MKTTATVSRTLIEANASQVPTKNIGNMKYPRANATGIPGDVGISSFFFNWKNGTYAG